MPADLVKTISPDNEVVTHLAGAFGIDYALCGHSLDDDPTVNRYVRYGVSGHVTCEACKTVVIYCRTVTL